MTVNYDSIPAELKEFPQWVCHGKDKIPLNPANGNRAETDNPSTWGTFEQAKESAEKYNLGVGFVITADCPYTWIDVDSPHKKGITDPDEIAMIYNVGNEILRDVDSYAELSPSGEGFHIITRYKVPSGHNKGCFEIYPFGRYMTVTGNRINDKPINGDPEAVHKLWELLSHSGTVQDTGYDEPEAYTDEQVIKLVQKNPAYAALAVGNRDEYWRLVGTKPADSSASVSDLNLMNRIAFFSRNRAQTARLFKLSGCHRPQVKKGAYVERSVAKAFDQMSPPIDLQNTALILENALAKQKQSETETVEINNYEGHSNGVGVYSNPGGLLGEIADYIHDSSVKPVPEIALATAITLMAGIAGRSYNIGSLGLNMYTMILAKSGTGKSAVRSGPQIIRQKMIDRAVKAAMKARSLKTITNIDAFFGPKTASGIALYKEFANRKSFAVFYDEMGSKLKTLWHPTPKADVEMEYDLYLNLFTESKKGGSLDELKYSDKDKSVKGVESPAFSWVGVTVPTRFYDAVNEKALNDGFLPRMLIIEYVGEVVKTNPNHSFPPSEQLMERLDALVENSHMVNSANVFQPIDVKLCDAVAKMHEEWDEEIRLTMNSKNDDKYSLIWSRVIEKTLKLAALVAVGKNTFMPVIDVESWNWARRICEFDANRLMKRYVTGELGESLEPKQIAHVRKVLKKFKMSSFESIAKFGVNSAQHAAGGVPRRYIQQNCKIAAFTNDRLGETFALDRALRTLLANGDIQKSKDEYANNGQLKTPIFFILDSTILTDD